MPDNNHFYFQSFEQWRQALTEDCKINLTVDYARSRVAALKDLQDKSTQEFKAKYGEAYLEQVIRWFEQVAHS